MAPLKNTRREKFCLALAEGQSAHQAYIAAGFKPSRHNAHRLSTKEHIQSRLAELQAAAQRNSEVTVASLLRELEDARVEAKTLKQLSACVRAVEAKARIAGLLTERIEVKNNIERYQNVTSPEDFAKLMWTDYRAEGYSNLDEKDLEQLGLLVRGWWDGMQAILAASKAKPIQPRMSDQQRENIERR